MLRAMTDQRFPDEDVFMSRDHIISRVVECLFYLYTNPCRVSMNTANTLSFRIPAFLRVNLTSALGNLEEGCHLYRDAGGGGAVLYVHTNQGQTLHPRGGCAYVHADACFACLLAREGRNFEA